MSEKGPAPVRVIRDKDFAIRLDEACDAHPHVPPYNFGRRTWVKKEIEKLGVKVSHETVRKWFEGETRPKQDKMRVLARLLGVDVGWLSLGLRPDVPAEEQKSRINKVVGAANLIAGFISINGGHPAFPDGGEDEEVDLFAIIGGRPRRFNVSLVLPQSDGKLKFNLPIRYEKVDILGVVPRDSFACDIIKFDPDVVSRRGKNQGGHIELLAERVGRDYLAGRDKLHQVRKFAEL